MTKCGSFFGDTVYNANELAVHLISNCHCVHSALMIRVLVFMVTAARDSRPTLVSSYQ